MVGKLFVATAGDRVSCEVEVTPKGVNNYELAHKIALLKDRLQSPAPFEAFLILPSKLNDPAFVIDESDV